LIEKRYLRHLVNSVQNQTRSTNWDSAIDRSIAIYLLVTPVTERLSP